MTDLTDAVATRRAVLAGALGVGAVALAPELSGEAAAAPIPTNPAFVYFLNVAGIPGDSTDARHAQWINLLTFSWGASTTVNPLSPMTSPATRSKPADFAFVARSTVASPKLFLACATGKAINNALLEVVKPGPTSFLFLKVRLENVRVASLNQAPSANDGVPLDVVRLRYAKVTHTFIPQKADGSAGTPVVHGFDFAADKAI